MIVTKKERIIRREYLVLPTYLKPSPFEKVGKIEIISRTLKDLIGKKVKVYVYVSHKKIGTKLQKNVL